MLAVSKKMKGCKISERLLSVLFSLIFKIFWTVTGPYCVKGCFQHFTPKGEADFYFMFTEIVTKG